MTADVFPFLHKVNADRLGDAPRKLVVEPDPDASQRMADVYHCTSIENLKADLTIKPWRKAGARVVGTLTAELIRECSVTLESFKQDFREEIDQTFEPASSRPRRAKDINDDGEIEIELETLDPPDVMLDGVIDLGALVCEQLALNIDPFSRKPGAVFAETEKEVLDDASERPSAFDVLAKLKDDSV